MKRRCGGMCGKKKSHKKKGGFINFLLPVATSLLTGLVGNLVNPPRRGPGRVEYDYGSGINRGPNSKLMTIAPISMNGKKMVPKIN